MSALQNKKHAALRFVQSRTSRLGLMQCSPLRCSVVLLSAMLCLILVTSTPVWAFDVQSSATTDEAKVAAVAKQLTTSSSTVIAGDPCLRLLKSFHIDSSSTAMNRSRRSVGETSSARLVFGIRFALGPNKVKQGRRDTRFDIWQPDFTNNPEALAMADYKSCKNNQALKVLDETWRWSR